MIRVGASDAELDAAIRLAIAGKPQGHDVTIGPRASVSRAMSTTGG